MDFKRIILSAIIVAALATSCGTTNENIDDAVVEPIITTETEVTTSVTEVTTTSITTTVMSTETDITTVSETDSITETEIVTDAPTSEAPASEAPVSEVKVENNNTVSETESPVVQQVEEYLVYKPSTYYAHRSTCRWNSGDAYKCDNFSGLETRICSECNPDVGEHIEYVAPEPVIPSSDGMTYVGGFKATYYPATAYYSGVCGGSGRTLMGYGDYGDGIKGSVACRSVYEMYGYNYNGRTTVYIDFPSPYDNCDGLYYVDDCCAYYGVVDVFVWDSWSCPFGNAGVVYGLDIYI